jgi:hypothetical protein
MGIATQLILRPRPFETNRRHEVPIECFKTIHRENAELRLELTLYQSYSRSAETCKDAIAALSQELLQASIHALLGDNAIEMIGKPSELILQAIDKLEKNKEKALDAFIAAHKALEKRPCTSSPPDDWF